MITKEIVNVKKTMYKSSRTDKLFDTYHDAFNADSIDFVDHLTNEKKYVLDINPDLFYKDDMTLYKLNNNYELEMFLEGIMDCFYISNSDSFLLQAKNIKNFPCIIIHYVNFLYTQEYFIDELERTIEDINDTYKQILSNNN